MINDVIDKYLKKYSVYHYDGWYWVINPNTKEWVVNVADSGYTFFCRDFWITFSKFYPSEDLTKDIHNWSSHKLGVPIGKHCHPDYIPHEYNWKDEFDERVIDEVILNGNK